MLRVAAFAAALVALGAAPLAGVDETDATGPDVTPLTWVATPSAGTVLETLDATPGQPTLHLHGGRTAVAARGDGEQRVLIQAGPVSIAVSEGLVLVDHVDGTCFVVVLVGSALVQGGASQDRGVLLQSRQGIASGADGMLADVLTFERVPRLNDPEPLALQALATTASTQEPWPQDVPLPGLAKAESTAPPEASPAISTASPPHATEPEPAAQTVAVATEPEPATSAADIEVPAETVAEIVAETEAAAFSPPSLTPAWQQRRGRR